MRNYESKSNPIRDHPGPSKEQSWTTSLILNWNLCRYSYDGAAIDSIFSVRLTVFQCSTNWDAVRYWFTDTENMVPFCNCTWNYYSYCEKLRMRCCVVKLLSCSCCPTNERFKSTWYWCGAIFFVFYGVMMIRDISRAGKKWTQKYDIQRR